MSLILITCNLTVKPCHCGQSDALRGRNSVAMDLQPTNTSHCPVPLEVHLKTSGFFYQHAGHLCNLNAPIQNASSGAEG